MRKKEKEGQRVQTDIVYWKLKNLLQKFALKVQRTKSIERRIQYQEDILGVCFIFNESNYINDYIIH